MKKTFAIAALFVASLAGTAVAENMHNLKVTAPSSAKANEKAVAKVSIEATGKWHVNKDYPHKLVLDTVDGVTLEKTKLTAKEAAKFDDKQLAFDVTFTSAKPGKTELKGKLKTAFCDEAATSCVPVELAVSVPVEVK